MKMYTEKRPQRSKAPYVIVATVLAVAVVIGIVMFGGPAEDEPNGGGASAGKPAEPEENPVPGGGEEPDPPVPGPAGLTRSLAEQIGPSPLTVTRVDAEKANDCYRKAVKLLEKDVPGSADLLTARELLNTAYVSEQLGGSLAAKAALKLEKLAAMTVLRPGQYVNDKDPYLLSYTFEPGDYLNSTRYTKGDRKGEIRKAGVIARHELSVPAAAIVRFNGLKSARTFRAGENYKLIRGPFHLVVQLSTRRADLYLRDLYVRGLDVCIGAPETPTPTGYFCIARGGKTRKSQYNPPVDSNKPNKTLRPGDTGYPLDSEGHNMKLRGIPQLGTDIPVSRSYAIHGTNDPSSVGKAASLGCLRFRAEDIALLYDCLQEYGDPEDPTVPWKHWSVIWIRK